MTTETTATSQDNNTNDKPSHTAAPAPAPLLQESSTSSSSLDVAVVGKISWGDNWTRRKQTMACFTCSLYFILPLIPTCWYWTLKGLLHPQTTAVVVAMYLGYAYLLDPFPTSGGYPAWIRRWKWWEHACDYFPMLLVKTAPLPATTNYVLGYHPHGIISVGALGAFATNGIRTLDVSTTNPQPSGRRGFSSLFPDLDRRLVTLPVNFNTPWLREYILGMGCVNSSKTTFRTYLSSTTNGKALVVVVGGAAESMLVEPGSIHLVLEKRRGFVREAIRANASLVPVLAFGETDLYHVPSSTTTSTTTTTTTQKRSAWMSRFQSLVKQMTGMAMPVFQGRSIFFRDFGLMPLRKPIVVVVGAPIAPPPSSLETTTTTTTTTFSPLVDRVTHEPLNEHGKILNEWHAKYIQAVKDLYEEYKDRSWNEPGKTRSKSLLVVQ